MPDKIQEPLAKDLPHPMQPIGWDGHGVIRFKRNAIVNTLLQECAERGGTDLNRIAILVQTGAFSVEDEIQLAQLIGYSVSGFGDLNYVPEEIVAQADAEADRISSGPQPVATEPESQPRLVEMDQAHRERVRRLLFETGKSPGSATQPQFMLAYQAVLTKDLLWTMNELLSYKQNEVHR